MTKIIPYELIKHLEWVPGQEVPQMPAPMPAMQSVLSIDEIVKNGKEFYSEEKDSEGKHYIGVAVALQQAYDEMGSVAVIASMPYLIAGKAKAEKNKNAEKAITSGRTGSLRFLRKTQALTRMESLPGQGKKLFLFFTAEAFLLLRESGRHTAKGLRRRMLLNILMMNLMVC